MILKPTAFEKQERVLHDEIEQLLSNPTSKVNKKETVFFILSKYKNLLIKDKMLIEKYKSVKSKDESSKIIFYFSI